MASKYVAPSLRKKVIEPPKTSVDTSSEQLFPSLGGSTAKVAPIKMDFRKALDTVEPAPPPPPPMVREGPQKMQLRDMTDAELHAIKGETDTTHLIKAPPPLRHLLRSKPIQDPFQDVEDTESVGFEPIDDVIIDNADELADF